MLKFLETPHSSFDLILTVHGSKLIEFGEFEYLPAFTENILQNRLYMNCS